MPTPETITINIKRKYLWLGLIVLLILLTASPILLLYAPISSSAPQPTPGTGVNGTGQGNAGSSSGPAPNCANPCTILIQSSVFGGNGAQIVGGVPTVVVTKGTVVYWKNVDDTSHTSTSLTGIWNTGTLAPGSTSKAVTFNSDGTFPYQCLIHPMSGQVIVVG